LLPIVACCQPTGSDSNRDTFGACDVSDIVRSVLRLTVREMSLQFGYHSDQVYETFLFSLNIYPSYIKERPHNGRARATREARKTKRKLEEKSLLLGVVNFQVLQGKTGKYSCATYEKQQRQTRYRISLDRVNVNVYVK